MDKKIKERIKRASEICKKYGPETFDSNKLKIFIDNKFLELKKIEPK